jgi:peroxin-5
MLFVVVMVQAWVQHHPKYYGLKIDNDAYSDGTMMDDVMQLMLKAAEWDNSDPQVHVVLGVLYNLSRDYDSAVAELKQAADLAPDDYAVWNKAWTPLHPVHRCACPWC